MNNGTIGIGFIPNLALENGLDSDTFRYFDNNGTNNPTAVFEYPVTTPGAVSAFDLTDPGHGSSAIAAISNAGDIHIVNNGTVFSQALGMYGQSVYGNVTLKPTATCRRSGWPMGQRLTDSTTATVLNEAGLTLGLRGDGVSLNQIYGLRNDGTQINPSVLVNNYSTADSDHGGIIGGGKRGHIRGVGHGDINVNNEGADKDPFQEGGLIIGAFQDGVSIHNTATGDDPFELDIVPVSNIVIRNQFTMNGGIPFDIIDDSLASAFALETGGVLDEAMFGEKVKTGEWGGIWGGTNGIAIADTGGRDGAGMVEIYNQSGVIVGAGIQPLRLLVSEEAVADDLEPSNLGRRRLHAESGQLQHRHSFRSAFGFGDDPEPGGTYLGRA